MKTRKTLKVAIVDYGTGNIASLDRAFKAIGASTLLASSPSQLCSVDAVVLPGVGHFGPASTHLRRTGLHAALQEQIQAGLPTLGICLGFQLLTQSSQEAPGMPGLALLPLHTERLEPFNSRLHKVPHLGWNTLDPGPDIPTLLRGIPSQQQLFYFANAYAVAPNPNHQKPQALYHHERPWLAVVERVNIHGVQFHPEKSRSQGLQVLRNFLAG
jgi:glutamine amidotransferase